MKTAKMAIDPIYLRSSSLRRGLVRKLLNSFGLGYSRASNREDILSCFRQFWPVMLSEPLTRLGADADGGYVVPELRRPYDAIFSPGVADNASFEEEYLLRYKDCRAFLLDGSIRENPMRNSRLSPRVEFEASFLGSRKAQGFVTLEAWVNSKYRGNNALLQVDIEGHEYEVFLSARDSILEKFSTIIIELHGLNMLGTREGCTLVSALANRLSSVFVIAHIHVNNYAKPINLNNLKIPTVLEVTWVRRDLVSINPNETVTSLPNRLDRPNDVSKPSYKLHDGFERGVLW